MRKKKYINKDKETIIRIFYNDNVDSSNMDDFFDHDTFFGNFHDFYEIMRSMDKIMENMFRESFSGFNDSFDRSNQILINPGEIVEPEEIEEDKSQEDYEVEKETDANIYYVSPNQLPRGHFWKALGLYVPSLHTIFIANNLSPKVEKFVYYHEIAHSLGIMDEEDADRYATKKCGYYIDLGKRPKSRYCKYFY